MGRRFFIVSGLSALAAPLAAEAQQAGKIYRIGMLWNTPNPPMEGVLLQGLRELGWLEGQNFVLERRYSEGRDERHPALAAELVRLRCDLILTAGTPAAFAAKAATTTIPVVFITVGDPVGSGLVQSLARPGGNLTGLASIGPEVAGKHVELLKEAIPSLTRLGVFINSAFSLHASLRPELEAASRRLGVALTYIEVRAPDEVDGAFGMIAKEKLRAVLVLGTPMWAVLRARLGKLALDHRVATMVPWREAAEEGGLMAYAEPIVEHVRRAPFHIDRILKGTRPADLPVEQPTKFELAINLKTAKVLGLTIPPQLLLRADRLIE
jgi:putative ABC transport system substrate-binding protein